MKLIQLLLRRHFKLGVWYHKLVRMTPAYYCTKASLCQRSRLGLRPHIIYFKGHYTRSLPRLACVQTSVHIQIYFEFPTTVGKS